MEKTSVKTLPNDEIRVELDQFLSGYEFEHGAVLVQNFLCHNSRFDFSANVRSKPAFRLPSRPIALIFQTNNQSSLS